MYEKKSVKLNKARPAPDFSKLHSKWQDKLQDGLAKAKKPSTVVKLIYTSQFLQIIRLFHAFISLW